jgi:uncharacterized HAD superfamily protein
MGKRLNVGVDIDGVLADFALAARTLCKQLFNGKPADDVIQTGWGLTSLGLTQEEENKMWRTIDTISNWWLNHKVMPDTDLLPALNEKHRVIFITNRKDGTGWPIEDQSKHWIKRNFGIYNATIIISDNKGPVAKGLNLHYFIDDRPKNVEEVCAGSAARVFIQDASYNQNKDYLDCVKRVKNFNEFASIILRGE